MRMVEALVKQSDHQITDSSSVLQNILAAAADERGEWHVPLSDDCLEAMRKVLSDFHLGRRGRGVPGLGRADAASDLLPHSPPSHASAKDV
jgi:hypothetical protein